ncbi:MAG: hypothetical protein Kow00121_04010 [Elainellaceae cyanobacterium]
MQQELRSQKPFENFLFIAGVLTFLLVATFAITVPYISQQHAFLGGDIVDGFYNRAINITEQFRQSPIAAFQTVVQEANKTYNSFYTVPLIPFLLVLGNSYLAYVSSIAIVYLLPLNLVLGAIATHLIPVYPRAVFLSTVVIATLTAPNWVTVFIGHPDIGGTLIIALAIWVAIWNMQRHFAWLLPDRWQVPLLGFLLGLGVLFRRHYAYASLAVIGAMVLQTLIVFTQQCIFAQQLQEKPRSVWQHLLGFGVRLGLVLATSLATLAVFAPKFTYRALTVNYVSLYDSWSRTIAETTYFYSTLYGWGTWLLVVLGFGTGILTQTLRLPVAAFVLLFGNLSLAIWLFKLRYTETYYAIHFVPMIILGISALVWTIWTILRSNQRFFLLGAIGLYLGLNFLLCLAPVGITQPILRPWFAANYPPPVRQNYDEIVQLSEFLRQAAPNQEPILVVHTGSLTKALLQSAERTVHGKEAMLNLVEGSTIDSVGYYPIQELLAAQYVVIAQPFLTWNPGQQETAKVVSDAFTQNWEITQDFEQLPTEFDLQNGVTAYIYRRIQPTPTDRAVRTLQAMQVQTNKPLSRQLDWVVLSQSSNTSIKQMNNQNYRLQVRAPDPIAASAPTFLYLGELREPVSVQARVQFKRALQCQPIGLQFSMLNQQGEVVNQSAMISISDSSNIQVSLASANASYMMLEIHNSDLKPDLEPAVNPACAVNIRNLSVR